MSIVALSMNILLGLLLVAALGMGWRLERRLKALRSGHDDFAKAVADLDAAAMRAQAGLMALRAASNEAEESLNDRIEAAKALVEQLERPLAEQLAAARPRRPAAPVAGPASRRWRRPARRTETAAHRRRGHGTSRFAGSPRSGGPGDHGWRESPAGGATARRQEQASQAVACGQVGEVGVVAAREAGIHGLRSLPSGGDEGQRARLATM